LNEENENVQKKEDIQTTSIDEEYEYRLVGVVDHMGSADAGHYLSFINVERD
jgi:ubiquitin C-terminal hydrolase